MAAVAPRAFRLVGADRTPLAALRWRPARDPIGAAVVLVHGLGEHLGRHAALAERLAAGGRLVLGADLRGHGRSGGQRGHVHQFGDYLEDLDAVIDQARRDRGGCGSVVLVGHSLGALVALRYAQRERGARPAGLVLSAIGLRPTVPVPRWKLRVAGACLALAPRLPFRTGIDADLLSRDPAVCAAYRRDPLAHRVVTPRWHAEFEAARAAALAGAGRVVGPVLVLHGLDDRIVDPAGSRELAGALSGADVSLRLYGGARHEVFTDPGCSEAIVDLERWLGRVGG